MTEEPKPFPQCEIDVWLRENVQPKIEDAMRLMEGVEGVSFCAFVEVKRIGGHTTTGFVLFNESTSALLQTLPQVIQAGAFSTEYIKDEQIDTTRN